MRIPKEFSKIFGPDWNQELKEVLAITPLKDTSRMNTTNRLNQSEDIEESFNEKPQIRT